MKKYVSGMLVDLTPEEILERESEEAAALREMLSAKLPAYRYAKETGGIIVSGIQIQTDRETRATLIGAHVLASQNPAYTIEWKTPSGFVILTSAQIIAISNAVATHVQKCYRAESELSGRLSSFQNVQEVEQAFDEIYSTLN